MRHALTWLLTLVFVVCVGAVTTADELTVQCDWKLLGIGLEAPDELALAELMAYSEWAIERELPGLDLQFDLARVKNYKRPLTKMGDRELVAYAVAKAEADGAKVADYDIVFVFSPLFKGPYFGYSHIGCKDKDGRAVRGCLITTRMTEVALAGAQRGIDKLEKEAQESGRKLTWREQLRIRANTMAKRVLDEVTPLAVRWTDRPFVREALIAPTVAHEFGHFLAAGDKNIRDGYETPWLRHATGPDDNPDGHSIDCCMYKQNQGDQVRFWLEKLVSMKGHLVVFCDACRKRMGCKAR